MSWKQQAQERFSVAKDANKWADIYKDAAGVEAAMFRKRRDFTVRYVLGEIPKNACVLDLGCGAGPVLEPLHQAGITCLGMDYSMDMLSLARKNLGAAEVPLIQGECEKIPLPDNSVDCIVCLGVISYAFSVDGAMRELKRVLKDGGVAIVSYRNRYNEMLLDPPKLVSSALKKPVRWLRSKDRETTAIGSALDPASVLRSAKDSGLHLVHRQPIGFGAIRLNGKVVSDGRLAHAYNRFLDGLFRVIPIRALHRLCADVHVLVLKNAVP
ncbi:class I SAM-dependent methyltransferase [Marinimicrobium sp. ABcell2]|uniref:class I SAM-dependent methyltransferase n=1 Tax=Marinimicrobium sp. ABcell2 TaxID=3069751 RepID=UPI0027B1D8E4|nr:class I SAM-dependent methyltransferase [Marinimicrobium sp. ABcell2]MDQ2076204.1 class I SAM-dependent methyltransferase [Marinimicrobium sp. ABcell2]